MATTYSAAYREMLRRLRAARRAAGFTQVQVAERLSLPQSVISKIETGERRIDPIELKRFAVLYGAEISDIIP